MSSGDGKGIILWRNKATGENYAWVMNGAEKVDGTFLETVTDLNWTIAGVADFNGNGTSDILWRNVSTGDNLVWFMNGASHTDSAFVASVPDINWTITGTGDFNADGKPDILWRNKATGDNYLWYMNGTSMIGGAPVDSVAELNWKIVAVGDYDGNGLGRGIWAIGNELFANNRGIWRKTGNAGWERLFALSNLGGLCIINQNDWWAFFNRDIWHFASDGWRAVNVDVLKSYPDHFLVGIGWSDGNEIFISLSSGGKENYMLHGKRY